MKPARKPDAGEAGDRDGDDYGLGHQAEERVRESEHPGLPGSGDCAAVDDLVEVAWESDLGLAASRMASVDRTKEAYRLRQAEKSMVEKIHLSVCLKRWMRSKRSSDVVKVVGPVCRRSDAPQRRAEHQDLGVHRKGARLRTGASSSRSAGRAGGLGVEAGDRGDVRGWPPRGP